MQAFLLCWIYHLETSSLWHPPRAPRALTSGIKVGVAGLSIGRWGRSKAWSCRGSVLETISVFKWPSFCVVFVPLRCRDVLQKKALFCVPDFYMRAGEKKKTKLGNLNSSMSSLGPKSHFLAIRSFQQCSLWGCMELQKKKIIFFWSWWTQYITLQTISGSKHPVFIA